MLIFRSVSVYDDPSSGLGFWLPQPVATRCPFLEGTADRISSRLDLLTDIDHDAASSSKGSYENRIFAEPTDCPADDDCPDAGWHCVHASTRNSNSALLDISLFKPRPLCANLRFYAQVTRMRAGKPSAPRSRCRRVRAFHRRCKTVLKW